MTVSQVPRFCLWLFLLALTYSAAAQDSRTSAPPASDSTTTKPLSPLAAAAQEAKARKAKAAKVITDEDVEAHKSPIPIMNLEGDDNTDEVLAAIQKYKDKHKPEETEAAVHDWYDEYDAILASNAREANQYRTLRTSNTYNGYDLCQQSSDYEHCEKRRQSELRGQRMDALKINQDMAKVGRIQQGLMRVRTGLMNMRLNYSWFKVRNGNGVGFLN